MTNRVVRNIRKMTIGYKFLIQWKDITTTWTPFNILEESNRVEVEEFVVSKYISDEPAFSWWVPFTLKKRDRIIYAINSIVSKKTYKFGVEVLMYIEHAKQLDTNNIYKLWQDCITKEMYQVLVAFKILEERESAPP